MAPLDFSFLKFFSWTASSPGKVLCSSWYRKSPQAKWLWHCSIVQAMEGDISNIKRVAGLNIFVRLVALLWRDVDEGFIWVRIWKQHFGDQLQVNVCFLSMVLVVCNGRSLEDKCEGFCIISNTLDSLKGKSNVNVTSLSCLCYQRSKYIHSTYTTACNFKIKFTYIFNMWFSTQNIASNVLISFPFVMKEELKSSLLESQI